MNSPLDQLESLVAEAIANAEGAVSAEELRQAEPLLIGKRSSEGSRRRRLQPGGCEFPLKYTGK